MRYPLRTRLVVATLALVVAGLAFAGVATYFFLRSFLVNRVDQELVSSENAAEHVLTEQIRFGQSDRGGPASGLPIGTYVALLDAAGKTVAHAIPGYPASASAPDLRNAIEDYLRDPGPFETMALSARTRVRARDRDGAGR